MEEEIQDELRTAHEIAKRSICVAVVTSVAYGDSPESVIEWLKREELFDTLSPNEVTFLTDQGFREKKKVNYTWGVEQLVPLLWSIGKLEKMGKLTSQCNTEELKRVMVWSPASTAGFLAQAQLRNEEEISDKYETVYEAHWKVRDAKLNERDVPDGLQSGVVYERHYAFNWLTGYMGQDWDEITTDT